MTNEFESIRRCFQSDIQTALVMCNEYLCSENYPTIEDMKKHFRDLPYKGRCDRVFTKNTLIVHCVTCSLYYSSCFCLDCFLHGNHKNHKAFLLTTESGTCDCGSLNYIKEEGICCKHSKENSDFNQFFNDEEKRKITEIVKLLLENIGFLSSFDCKSSSMIFNYLNELAALSIPITLLIAEIVQNSFDICDYILNVGTCSSNVIKLFIAFISSLFISPRFCCFYTENIIKIFSKFTWLSFKIALDSKHELYLPPLLQLSMVQNNFFYAFQISPIQHCVNNIDWVSAFKQTLEYIIQTSKHYEGDRPILNVIAFRIIENIFLLVKSISKIPSQKQNLISASEIFANVIAPIEGFLRVNKSNQSEFEYGDQEFSKLIVYIMYMIKLFRKIGCKTESVYEPFLNNFITSLINDEFDDTDDSISFFRSINDDGVKTSLSFGLHILAWQTLISNDNVQEAYADLFNHFELFGDDLSLYWSLIPLRFIVMINYCSLELFGYDQMYINEVYTDEMRISQIFSRYVPAFLIVQTMLGLIETKETFLAMILHTFGLFSPEIKTFEKAISETAVLLFISCLLFDRDLAKYNKREINKQFLITKLIPGPKTITKLLFHFKSNTNYSDEFIEDFLTVAKRDPYKTDGSFQISSIIGWHILLPWMSFHDIMEASNVLIEKLPHRLLPFPEFTMDTPYNINLIEALYSPIIYSLIYQVISNSIHKVEASNQISLHIVLNLLIALSKNYSKMNFPKVSSDNLPTIVSDSLDELFSELPNDFKLFIKQPVRYMNREETTIMEMLPVLGKISNEVLLHLIPDYKIQEISESEKKKNKEIAELFHKEILSEIAEEPPIFQIIHLKDEKPPYTKCSISGKTNDLFIPVTFYRSHLPAFLGFTTLPPTVISLYPDDHAICPSEFNAKSNNYQCPECKRKFNAFLPLSPNLDNSTIFLDQCFGSPSKKISVVNCAFTLSYEFKILELRQRTNPFALDSLTEKIMLCKLFEVLSIVNEAYSDYDYPDDSLTQLLLLCHSRNTDEQGFKGYVSIFIPDLENDGNTNLTNNGNTDLANNGNTNLGNNSNTNLANNINTDLLIFLRCSRIISNYLFDCPIVDWEEDMQLENLFSYFNIPFKKDDNGDNGDKNDNGDKSDKSDNGDKGQNGENGDKGNNGNNGNNNVITLQPFELKFAKDSFISLFENVTEKEIQEGLGLALCLFTGKVVNLSNIDNEKILTKSTQKHIKDNCDGTFTCFIGLTSSQTKTWIETSEGQKIPLRSLYLDQFGMDDVGLTRKSSMSLSPTRHDYVLDMILSGQWVNY